MHLRAKQQVLWYFFPALGSCENGILRSRVIEPPVGKELGCCATVLSALLIKRKLCFKYLGYRTRHELGLCATELAFCSPAPGRTVS